MSSIGMRAAKPAMPVESVVDAESVFDSVTADPVKNPDDKHMLPHALKFREWANVDMVRVIWWSDTETWWRMA